MYDSIPNLQKNLEPKMWKGMISSLK